MRTPLASTETLAADLIRVRLSQLFINEEYKAGKFKIPVHLAMGHEALAVAVHHVLDVGDKLVLSHRNIAYNLAQLGAVRPVLEEYLLRPSGLAHGKLGSMNLINPKKNIIYASSILGNNFPVATGVAMEERVSGHGGVTFVLGGDGSMEEGSFYESLEIAKVHKLAVIYVIENNEWSLATKISERRAHIDLEGLANALGISFNTLSGNEINGYIKKLEAIRAAACEGMPQCVEVAISTLGDRRGSPTPEFPGGKYINYHSGPASTVSITDYVPHCILRDDEGDPLYVIMCLLGEEKFLKISEQTLAELKKELS
jgi:TPP-dependent pyruvate/acetoin dehydrogenase alpha subunit